VGTGPGIRRVLSTVRTVSALNVTVLLRGESGTGKDLAARHIHMLSPRANRPMVTINCPTIPESLLESELFGHVKGAFTGADSDSRGLLKEASGSSLFLDEIGDISPTIQTKLLRLIQEKEIKPLGSSSSSLVDVRIIASTNRNLEAKIKDGSFREDLFYRLNVVSIRMPQLREIREDILLLAQHFMKQAASEFGLAPKEISGEAVRYLMAQTWPGNVRQLKNAVQKAMIFSTGSHLQVHDFTEDDEHYGSQDLPTEGDPGPFRELRDKLVANFTKQYLVNALQRNSGNVSAAARESALERQHFQQLLRKHRIDPGRFRRNGKK
jgi:DNA-binding NtrC family response regulator